MNVQVHFGKPQPWVWPVTFVCLALGALIATMIKAATPRDNSVNPSAMTKDQLVALYTSVARDRTALQDEKERLQGKIRDLQEASISDQKLTKEWQKQLDELRARCGETAYEGPGIVITLDDSKPARNSLAALNPEAMMIHDTDILELVNELRSAGAEAIAVNDQRVVASTAIRCVGPVIQVNFRPVSAPFTVRAIGKVDTLFGAANLPNGKLDELRALETIKIDVEKRDSISVPTLTTLPPLEVGRPVNEKPR